MKNAFIIGGSSGIGKATAERFLAESYSVTNLSRTACPVGGVKNIFADVTDKREYQKALEKFVRENDSLSAFVYSAGFSMAAPLEYAREEDYRYLFEVNFFGYMTALKYLLPPLKKAGGTAVAVSSLGGVVPIAFDAYYSSSKAALNMLTYALRAELSSTGVNVVSVMPGGTKTAFTEKRKVYPPAETGEYSPRLESAVKRLADIERNGMDASAVAAVIYKKCASRPMAHTFAAGAINKLCAAFAKFIPQSVMLRLLNAVYFS